MNESKRGAALARPLAFTLLMLYGLMTFLVGYEDWQRGRRIEAWIAWALIVTGVLLGSAAIRVLSRRRRAFQLSAFALLVLIALDLFFGITPADSGAWKYHLGRVVLSAAILFLVRRADRALA